MNPDRKYLDRKNLVLDFSYEILMESYIEMDRASNENTQIDTNYYEIINKFDKNELVYLTPAQEFHPNLPKPRNGFFNWLGLNKEKLMGLNKEILNCTPLNLKLGSWFFPELVLTYNLYETKPWAIPSQTLLENALSENSEKKNIEENQKKGGESFSNKKIKNQKDKKKNESVESKRDLTSNVQNQGNAESVPSKKDEKDIKGPPGKVLKRKKKLSRSIKEIKILIEKCFLVAQLIPNNTWTEQATNNINVGAWLTNRKKIRTLFISSIKRGQLSLDILLFNPKQPLFEMTDDNILGFEPIRLSVENDGQFIMYQTLGISLAHKIKHEINQGSRKQPYVDRNGFDLLVPETILSHRRRRELRILISLNSKTWNKNPIFWTENNCSQSLDLDKENHLNKDKNELIKFKFFLWPNYRLEDLACMNRYWFNTNNGSRFSMLRIRMYPRLKSR